MKPLPVGETPLSDRAQRVFRTLVELYIRNGQPVGSRTLAREAGLDVSPATIRNVMADLEDMGLVTSPHTSAGRIPTARGYRLFVDKLLTVMPPPSREVQRWRSQLDPDRSTQDLLAAASALLSGITQLAGLVTLPRHETLALRHVAFLPLSDRRVLAVLVVNEREVQQRVLRTGRDYSAAELERAARYLNEVYAGQDLNVIRVQLVKEIRETRNDMDSTLAAAHEMGRQAFAAGAKEEDYVLAGEENLLACDELANQERMRQLFEAFSQKRDILHLLDQCLHSDEVQVLIGAESGYDVLAQCSLVTSPYTADGHVVGVVGVIGPTRMPYQRVIPIVDMASRLLGAALNHQH